MKQSHARLLIGLLVGIVLTAASGGSAADKSDEATQPPFGREAERHRMVARQIEARGVRDRKVLAAMRRVPRHLLIPKARRLFAYGDHPVPIGYGQTVSQPYIVGYMTEVLQLTKDAKVLEVGTGSGYQAAVLAEITPHTYTMEIVPELAQRAAEDLKALGYEHIHAREGDGYNGWESESPWDAVVVTAASEHVPPPLIKQLKPGGRMCIPVGSPFGTQYLLLVEKKADGSVSTRNLMPVRFVPLTRKSR